MLNEAQRIGSRADLGRELVEVSMLTETSRLRRWGKDPTEGKEAIRLEASLRVTSVA